MSDVRHLSFRIFPVVLRVQIIASMAQWLSWLERRPVTAEVEGSSPFWVVSEDFRTRKFQIEWDHSSAGRAPALQAGGHRFEPCWSHYADVAQLVEQLICNQQVRGSSPFIGFYLWYKTYHKFWMDSRAAKGGRL